MTPRERAKQVVLVFSGATFSDVDEAAGFLALLIEKAIKDHADELEEMSNYQPPHWCDGCGATVMNCPHSI
jgi:hypothetical protein